MYELNATQAECLSELEVDEWLAGELEPAETQRCLGHVASCAACRDKQLAIEQVSAGFYAQAPSFDALRTRLGSRLLARCPASLPAPRRSRTQPSWHKLSLPLAAAGVGLLALLVLRPGSAPDVPGETRAKGAPRLGYYLKRADAVVPGEPGTKLRAGDSLRFVYSHGRPSYFAIFSADAQGVSVYYPSTARAVFLPAAQDAALDFSVELDDHAGPEHVTALFCREPFDVESARSALASKAPLPAALAACARSELELNKQ